MAVSERRRIALRKTAGFPYMNRQELGLALRKAIKAPRANPHRAVIEVSPGGEARAVEKGEKYYLKDGKRRVRVSESYKMLAEQRLEGIRERARGRGRAKLLKAIYKKGI